MGTSPMDTGKVCGGVEDDGVVWRGFLYLLKGVFGVIAERMSSSRLPKLATRMFGLEDEAILILGKEPKLSYHNKW